MKGMLTGLGVTFGAACGLLLGQLLLGDWWVGPLIGAVVGLLVGAVADLHTGSESTPRPTPRPH